ncbi:MAG: PAS domain S-box protein [Phycisphaeraceae bacterium]|nr:PAS domain S-box protein [Phycisphaeraceae bacterium]
MRTLLGSLLSSPGVRQRRRTADRLREMRLKLDQVRRQCRMMTRSVQEMVSVHDARGVFVWCSEASRPILGYEPSELIGRSAYEFFHPEDLSRIAESHVRVTDLTDVSVVTYRFRRKDGGYAWLETASQGLRDHPTERPRKIMAVSRDLSEQAAGVEQSARGHEVFQRVVEMLEQGVWAVDADFNTTYVSPSMARMLGLEAVAIVGRSVFDFIDPHDKDQARRNIQRRRKGVTEPLEFHLTRRDGRGLWVAVRVSSLLDEQGRCVGGVAILTDITASKTAASHAA